MCHRTRRSRSLPRSRRNSGASSLAGRLRRPASPPPQCSASAQTAQSWSGSPMACTTSQARRNRTTSRCARHGSSSRRRHSCGSARRTRESSPIGRAPHYMGSAICPPMSTSSLSQCAGRSAALTCGSISGSCGTTSGKS